METITLTRTVPKGAFYDVIVCGSGPSGITAALSAARAGKRTALIERYGVVGGNLTIGHVGPILGVVGPGTMRDEIMPLLGVPDNDELGVVGVAHDFERAKSVLTHLLDAENIDTYLQSPVVDVVMDGDEIAALIIGSKEGLLGLSAKIYIDATGDGDVAALAGGIVEYGRPGDGLAQPVTLEFLIDGVDESKAITCIGEVDDVSYKGEPFIEYTKRHAQAGNLPEHLFSVRLHRTTVSGQRNVNTTQMNKINALKPGEMMIAEAELRRQIYQVTDFLNKHVEGYENARVISSSGTLGVRETRRVIGDYVLSGDDVKSGRKFDDVIVHDACFIVDIHNPTGGGQSTGGAPEEAKPYDIPYRCFLPKGIENLYTTGRCISGTHEAMASYRVMSICLAMGQAIGVSAAECVTQEKKPRELEVATVQKKLENLGVILFG